MHILVSKSKSVCACVFSALPDSFCELQFHFVSSRISVLKKGNLRQMNFALCLLLLILSASPLQVVTENIV